MTAYERIVESSFEEMTEFLVEISQGYINAVLKSLKKPELKIEDFLKSHITTFLKTELDPLRVEEINPGFKIFIDENGGYCPCALEKTEDTLCPCKTFREQTTPGECFCGRYRKVPNA